MAKGRITRKEIADLDPITDTTINYELSEDYFRDIANSTVKPVIERLKEVYYKHGRKYGWNLIMGLGLKLYGLHKQGYDVDIAVARVFNKKFGLPEAVLRDIVNAIEAEAKAVARR